MRGDSLKKKKKGFLKWKTFRKSESLSPSPFTEKNIQNFRRGRNKCFANSLTYPESLSLHGQELGNYDNK